MKRTEHVIYDNYDIYNEDCMKDARQQLVEDGIENPSDSQLYDICNDWDRFWFEDEQAAMKELDSKCNEIIAIADLGLWNGRHTGYKDYKNLKDIMYSSCDYEKIYVDSYGNLRKTESHHDGTNTILYRQWKDDISDTQKDNFRNKCYEGKLTKADITRYTASLGKLFSEYYGW